MPWLHECRVVKRLLILSVFCVVCGPCERSDVSQADCLKWQNPAAKCTAFHSYLIVPWLALGILLCVLPLIECWLSVRLMQHSASNTWLAFTHGIGDLTMLASTCSTAKLSKPCPQIHAGTQLQWPRGGPQAIADALVRGLRHYRGKLLLDCHVQQVLQGAGGRAAGVRLRSGGAIAARKAVVSNASTWDTRRLLPPGAELPQFQRQVGGGRPVAACLVGAPRRHASQAAACHGDPNQTYHQPQAVSRRLHTAASPPAMVCCRCVRPSPMTAVSCCGWQQCMHS